MTEEPRMDCHQAAGRLYEYLDGELTPEIERTVREHLSDCAPCFSLFNFEETYVKFLSARTQARKAPQHLKRRIFEQILLQGNQLEEE